MQEINNFEQLYDKFVQMDDRFESVHIWNESLAIKNAGRWIPIEITEAEYLKEKEYSWNK